MQSTKNLVNGGEESRERRSNKEGGKNDEISYTKILNGDSSDLRHSGKCCACPGPRVRLQRPGPSTRAACNKEARDSVDAQSGQT